MSHPAWAVSPYTRDALDALPAQVDETTSPAVIDEAMYRMDLESIRIGAEIRKLVDYLHAALGEKPVAEKVGDNLRWLTATHEILETARVLPADTPNVDNFSRNYKGYPTVGSLLAAYDVRYDQYEEIFDARRPLAEQYDERRWERVYLVDNSGGHVHRHTACRTCYVTTEFCWITELSDTTDVEVIEKAGERTCLVCFPEVRAEILAGRPCRVESREGRNERVKREAEAAAKKAEKIAKGITPDGKPLVVRLGGIHPERIEIKTERAAELRYVELMAQPRLWSHLKEDAPEYYATADEVLNALAWKRNTTPDALRKTLEPKVAAKVKRERDY